MTSHVTKQWIESPIGVAQQCATITGATFVVK